MGKIIMISVLLAFACKVSGQVQITITEIEIAKNIQDIGRISKDVFSRGVSTLPRFKVSLEIYNKGPGNHSFIGGTAVDSLIISYIYKGEMFRIPVRSILQMGNKIPPGGKYAVKLLFNPHFVKNKTNPLNQEGYGKMLLEILPSITIQYGSERGFFISKYVEFAKADLSDWDLISIKKVDTSDVEYYNEDRTRHYILSQEEIAKRNVEFYRGPRNKIRPEQLKFDDISISKVNKKAK